MRFLYLLLVLIVACRPSVITADYEVSETAPAPQHTNEYILASYGQDRCCRPGCITRVVPGVGELVARVIRSSKATSIYFSEDSSRIDLDEKTKIREFVRLNPDARDITIIGYADGCGGSSYNHLLSLRRAEAAKREYQRITDGVRVRVRPAGEVASGHNDIARRVDITTTSNVTVFEPPPKIVADVYLVDASGSMSDRDWELWRRAIAFHRPPGSRVYISTTSCIGNGRNYSSIQPSGGTEIWFSYWSVIDHMQPGEALLVISDFDSDYPLTGSERDRLTRRVQNKGVTSRHISLGR